MNKNWLSNGSLKKTQNIKKLILLSVEKTGQNDLG